MKPTTLMISVTEKCNSKCVMCNTWQNSNPCEIDYGTLNQLIANNLDFFDEVRSVAFVGGEPLLYQDLAKLAIKLPMLLPRLSNIGFPTNALRGDFGIRTLRNILDHLPKSILLGVSVSVDGVGKTHERIRGVRGSFGKVESFIDGLNSTFRKQDNFYLTITTTLIQWNILEIQSILDFARNKGVRVTIRPGILVDSQYIDNASGGQSQGWILDLRDSPKWAKLFFSLHTKTGNSYYAMLADAFEGRKRVYPCPFQSEGLVLFPDFQLSLCLFSSQAYLGALSPEDNLSERLLQFDYRGVQRKLIQSVCGSCLSECNTSRSTKWQCNDRVAELLAKILESDGSAAMIDRLIRKSKEWDEHSFFRLIDQYLRGESITCKKQHSSIEEEIFFHFLGLLYQRKFRERNGISVHSLNAYVENKNSADGKLKAILSSLFLGFYIIKWYSKAQTYANLIERYFSLSIEELALFETVKRRMQNPLIPKLAA